MSIQESITIKVPHQNLDHSTFFTCEEASVAQWVTALPMANLGQTTRQLYQALTELNHIRLLPAKRLALLEKLRTPIYYATNSLRKHYLNQPIVLAGQPRKVAELAHTLHQQLAVGYTIVATHTAVLGKRAGKNKGQIIATALHRAITDHSINIRRHYQLYQPVKKGIWHNLHQLYKLAHQHKLINQHVEDVEISNCTLNNGYLRALLIGCCKPNQLRQEDFRNFLKPLTQWAEFCELKPNDNDSLFLIDPDGDQPPAYRELFPAVTASHWMSLHTLPLVKHLQQLKAEADTEKLTLDVQGTSLSRDLLDHLIQSWGCMRKRSFIRVDGESSMNICIGLSATHHFVSGELNFEALAAENDAKSPAMQSGNIFLKTPLHQHRQHDIWDSPYDADAKKPLATTKSLELEIRNNARNIKNKDKGKYRSQDVAIINFSAHGYCVGWPEEAKVLIKTGEIVGIKESRSQNWSIAVIRWVSHEEHQNIQLGLELISPSAASYGARVIHKKGAPAEYLRVLILPGIPAAQQPPTLLTPRVPFRAKQKVMLNQWANKIQIQLGNRTNTSGSYNQFEFQRIKGISSDSSDKKQLDNFDSLWENL